MRFLKARGKALSVNFFTKAKEVNDALGTSRY